MCPDGKQHRSQQNRQTRHWQIFLWLLSKDHFIWLCPHPQAIYAQWVSMWPFQVNCCEEITRIMWPTLFHKIEKQKISPIQSIPSEFSWHAIISGNLLKLRFYSTPFSMSLSQSFISHLISLVLGACTSLGNHLGERQVFIQNILVHWANEESEKIGAFILYNALSCFTMLILDESKLSIWHMSGIACLCSL